MDKMREFEESMNTIDLEKFEKIYDELLKEGMGGPSVSDYFSMSGIIWEQPPSIPEIKEFANASNFCSEAFSFL